MYYNVVKAKHLHDFILEIEFDDGKKGIVDFTGYAEPGTVFEKFADMNYFLAFYINPETRVLTWPGEIDVAPETLYSEAACLM